MLRHPHEIFPPDGIEARLVPPHRTLIKHEQWIEATEWLLIDRADCRLVPSVVESDPNVVPNGLVLGQEEMAAWRL
jgi:hypothetical protein